MIKLESITKSYGAGQLAVKELSLQVDEGELCCLIGPSGCGKTTTLKMVNRLIEPTSGAIYLDAQNVLELDPVQLRRRVGYVMQHGGLFPHRRVGENVAVVPSLLGWDRAKVRARVQELLALVGLDPDRYERRYPHELSGGERQRVGVARALGGDPPVLLMDEPFGAVDPITRRHLQEEFINLQARLKKTVLFVTHDMDEAVRLSTRIAIMGPGGVLQQFDTPAEVLSNPASEFVAEFVSGGAQLELLEVVPLALQHLSKAPEISATATPKSARAELQRAGATIGVLVDERGRHLGVLGRSELDGAKDGSPLRARALRIGGPVRIGSSLKTALSACLCSESGVIEVIDATGRVGLLSLEDLHAAVRDERRRAQ